MDHVEQYKIPKNPDKLDDEAIQLIQEGCGPETSFAKQGLVQSSSSRNQFKDVKMFVKK